MVRNNCIVPIPIYPLHELLVRCGPCKMIAPHLEEMSKDTSVVFLKVDVDDCEDIAAEYKVNIYKQ